MIGRNCEATMYHAVGQVFIFGLLAAVFMTLTYLLWSYLSTAICYWWVRIKTPAGINNSFKSKRLWHARLFFMILVDFDRNIQLWGTIISNDLFRIDFTGLIPRYEIK